MSYEYEAQYEHDTRTSQRGQYKPDFHLPDAGIYIEHFALNASGNTPPFIDRKQYLHSMEWKRGLHAEHSTVLIETFSHEKAAGRLTQDLAEKLAARGVTFSPIPSDQVFVALQEQERVDPFTRLVATFLHHFKGAQLSSHEVARRANRYPPTRLRSAQRKALHEAARVPPIGYRDNLRRAAQGGQFCTPIGGQY